MSKNKGKRKLKSPNTQTLINSDANNESTPDQSSRVSIENQDSPTKRMEE
jgi:hypothetical protein